MTCTLPDAVPLTVPLRALRSLVLVQVQMHQQIKPYQQLRYWSNVPFRHYQCCQVFGYTLPRQPGAIFAKEQSERLQDELIRHLNEDTRMSAFDFGLQFLDADRMTCWGKRRNANFWIENASVEWNEAEAPFHTIARLTLLPKSQFPPEAGARVCGQQS